MESSSDEEEQPKPTFRIRFTIGNNRELSASSDNVRHCDHSPFDRQDEKPQCNHQIDHQRRPYQLEPNNLNKVKLYRFIEPQNHKSALFVNLSDSSSGNNNPDNQGDRHLFISPTLNDQPGSPSSSINSAICSSTGSYEIIDPNEVESEDETEYNKNNGMSHGCNFINWMSASRRRASSVTPSPQVSSSNSNESPSATGRNAASTDDLIAANQANNSSTSNQQRSSSGNHLAISNETVCAIERNKPAKSTASEYVHLDLPVEVQIDSPDPGLAHPVNLDDILQIDMDTVRLEEECQELEAQARYWEEKVEELERKQFAEDVPRTLVENIIKYRKDLRNLEFQLYLQELESEESISSGGKLSYSPSDHQLSNNNSSPMEACLFNEQISPAAKFGSSIKPGQENTADILDAIPPSSSQQRRQYLTKSSRGTDTSEYSQLPHFNQFRQHPIGSRFNRLDQTPSPSAGFLAFENDHDTTMVDVSRQVHENFRHHSSRHHHISRRHVQVQMANEKIIRPEYENKLKSSPVRPNHFKTDFNSAHDSSPTTSSSSSPHQQLSEDNKHG